MKIGSNLILLILGLVFSSSLSYANERCAKLLFHTPSVRSGGQELLLQELVNRHGYLPASSTTKSNDYFTLNSSGAWGGYASVAVGRPRVALSFEHIPATSTHPPKIQYFVDSFGHGVIATRSENVDVVKSYKIKKAGTHNYASALDKDVMELFVNREHEGVTFESIIAIFGSVNEEGKFKIDSFAFLKNDLLGGPKAGAVARPVEGWMYSSEFVNKNEKYVSKEFSVKFKAADGKEIIESKVTAQINDKNDLQLLNESGKLVSSIDLTSFGITKEEVLLVRADNFAYELKSEDPLSIFSFELEGELGEGYTNHRPLIIVREDKQVHLFVINDSGRLVLQKKIKTQSSIERLLMDLIKVKIPNAPESYSDLSWTFEKALVVIAGGKTIMFDISEDREIKPEELYQNEPY